MVEILFSVRRPQVSDRLLDPGCGLGAFIEGVLRWCARNHSPVPEIVGVESDPRLLAEARKRFRGNVNVEIRAADFLNESPGTFDFIIGNPPYVSITGLDEAEKAIYRRKFRTATGRFDLYFLFFEQAVKSMREGARLVFITPEKFMYVDSAAVLRQLLAKKGVQSVELIAEDTFPGLVTYPAITTVQSAEPGSLADVRDRKGTTRKIRIPENGGSWLPRILGHEVQSSLTLDYACRRISAGVATGADGVYVRERAELPKALLKFAHQTVAGRQISANGVSGLDRFVMLIPYSSGGDLLPASQLGALSPFLKESTMRARLEQRSCVTRSKSPKAWYAFHETPPLVDILKPKILCKDIASEPIFVADEAGTIVPRHSAYYIVPRHPEALGAILDHLNSQASKDWLQANCQRAANDFLRLQSSVLKRLPISDSIGELLQELDEQNILTTPARRAAV